ncbi:MAG: DUF1223 domain-containing protein [Bryobacteraceae bacterium]
MRFMPLLAMVVVELFTSQGCSSCPPADALLAVLDKDPNVLALSEHVDYWNHLGWRDPYSSSAFSARQQRYARRFGQDGPYTPQMVVDGRVQFVGSDARQARSAITQAGMGPKVPVTLVREGDSVRVTVPALPAGGKTKSAELWVALVRPEGAAEVSRGENNGRTLRHVAIVRSLAKAGTATREAGVAHTFTLPPAEGGAWRVVAFLQEPGQGTILGGGRL